MDDAAANEHEESSGEPDAPRWPQRQVYFVTIEWLDESHRPERPERLARAIRHLIEHGHSPTPDAAPAPFVVRVKAGEVITEIQGRLEGHKHHG